MHQIKVTVNGESYQVEVPAQRTLLDFLRQNLELMGTKSGCETGDCGACTVLLNGKAVNSCLVLAVETDGKEVLTVEGLTHSLELHPLQEAFVKHGAIQCGYCTPGMLLSAKALLDEIPRPTEDEIKEALAGNLCRCTGYYSIVKAVMAAAEKANP
ncbi:MAG: (2Fe-2S)-binding protein [Thermodesulfobacteriota bacterium]|nr:(2Fe-2S)-binding protein [Thermodesulfobacteriota bacterium]